MAWWCYRCGEWKSEQSCVCGQQNIAYLELEAARSVEVPQPAPPSEPAALTANAAGESSVRKGKSVIGRLFAFPLLIAEMQQPKPVQQPKPQTGLTYSFVIKTLDDALHEFIQRVVSFVALVLGGGAVVVVILFWISVAVLVFWATWHFVWSPILK